MVQTSINIRIDADLKKQFDAFCARIGMNMTTAFNVFAKTVVRQQKIPFEISAETDPFYSEENQEHLRKVIEKFKKDGECIVKTIEELEAMEGE